MEGMDHLTVGVLICRKSRNGRIRCEAVNKPACLLFGISAEQVIQAVDQGKYEEICAVDRHVAEQSLEELFCRMHASCEFCCKKRPGEIIPRWIRAEGNVISQEDGSAVGYICLTDVSKSREEERILQQNNHLLEVAINTSGTIFWEFYIQKKMIVVPNHNKSRHVYAKYHLDEVIRNVPDSLVRFVREEDREAFLQMHQALENGASSATCDIWYKETKDVPPCCERITYSVLKDRNGEPEMAIGIGQNITAQKQQEANYKRVVGEMMIYNPDTLGIFRFNLTQDLYLDGNEQNKDFFKKIRLTKMSEWFAVCASYIMSSADRKEFLRLFDRDALLQAYKTGQTVVSAIYCYLMPDGMAQWLQVRTHTVGNPDNGELEVTASLIDYQKKRTEAAIMHHIANDDYDFIALINTRNNSLQFYTVNTAKSAVRQGTQVDYEEDVSNTAVSLVVPEEQENFRQSECLERVLEELRAKDSYSFTYTQREMIQGKEVRSRKRIQYIYLTDRHARILMTKTDVSELYRRERQQLEETQRALEEARQASRAKTVFLSNISHDMRTPLNGILGFTRLAQQENDLEKKADYLDKIMNSGTFLLDMINDTLELSRIESGKQEILREKVRTEEMLQQVIVPIRVSAGHKGVVFQMHTEQMYHGEIWADRMKTQKILLNLLSNAVKYTPAGGCVTLTITHVPDTGDQAHARIVVADNGIGMKEEFQRYAFEPFFQEHAVGTEWAQGSGLGLAIVKNFCTLLGGSVTMESRPGHGTVFTVELPVQIVQKAEAEKQLTGQEQPLPLERLRGKRILLCEDNQLNTELAVTILEHVGIQVDTASDGEEGVRKFQYSQKGAYDAILMDIRMPGMNGIEATKKIRSLSRKDAATIPILAMTANAFDEDVKQTREAGMNAHLAKPIEPELLFREILRWV